MRTPTLVALVSLAFLTLAAPAVANDCGDIALFSRNSANPVGANTNAALCTAGEIDALPSLINPASDLVKVRFFTSTSDPETPTVDVTLTGLGFEGATVLATRVTFAAGPDAYDTPEIPLPDGAASSGELLVVVTTPGAEGPVELARATYATADDALVS